MLGNKMESVRTRNLKELRQKRLQYFEQNQTPNQATNDRPPLVTDKQKVKQTGQSERSILAWDIPVSSPSVSRKKPSVCHSQNAQNCAPFHSQVRQELQPPVMPHPHANGHDTYRINESVSDTYRINDSGSDTYRLNGSYVSPLRRSLNHAHAFSTQHNVVHRDDEFRYTYKDFHPVDRDKFFTTKPVEDATWPRHRYPQNTVEERESSVSSSRVLQQSRVKVDDLSFDAEHVENILHEMGVVRKMKIQVHNELKTNFENRKNGTKAISRYGHLGAKYGDQVLHSAAKYSHVDTKEGHAVDVNHNTHVGKTTSVSKLADDRQSNKPDISQDQSIEKDQIDAEAKRNLDKAKYGNPVESEEGDSDEEFNIGALQIAAKQGDDILRKYIKRLSQRLHDKAANENSSDDSLERNLQGRHVDRWESDSEMYGSLTKGTHVSNTQSNKQNPDVYRIEERLQSKEQYGYKYSYDKYDLLKRGDIKTHNEKPSFSETDLPKREETSDEQYSHGNRELVTDLNHVTASSNHVTENEDHVTGYQPKIAEAAMTSSKFQELGLLDDIFARSSKSSAKPSSTNELEEDQVDLLDPDEESVEYSDNLQLQTHRAGQRPFSPLKNAQVNGKLSGKPADFPYVHVPSADDEASDSVSDMDTDIRLSDDSRAVQESDRVSNKYQRPKPPIAKKPSISFTRGHRTNSPSGASKQSNTVKRPKTPERHVDGVREHHEKGRDARKLTGSSSIDGKPATGELSSPKRVPSPTHEKSFDRAAISVVDFQRGVTPEPKWQPSVSVPSLDLDEEDDSGIHGDGGNIEDDGDLDEAIVGHEDDNETVLMDKIANFRPSFSAADEDGDDDDDDGPIGAGGDANGFRQVSFELPHQDEIDKILGRSPDQQRGTPAVRPSSAGPQRSKTGVLHRGRPSSAKSKVSQYMEGSNLFKRRWATSSSLWGSRSTSSAGDLQVAGQRSKYTDSSSRSPALVRKNRPGSAKSMIGGGGGDAGSKGKGQRSRPWSASFGGSRQKEEEDFLTVGSSQLQDGQVVRALDSVANRSIHPLTMQLIVESPRTSEGISVWQLLPDEILLHIFNRLNHYELVQCAQTCSFFNRIALDDSLWRNIQLEKQVVTDFGLTQIGERHPTHLGIVQCTGNITENGLRNLFRSCAENLKELNVSGCSNGELSGDSLLLHASRCYNLRSLDASWCSVTDNGLTAINDSVNGLNSLCLNGCREVSDQCLRAVIEKHGKSLNVLEVFGCFNLSTDSLKFVGETCKHLRTLNIGQCYKLTDDSIGNLAPHIKGIRHLDLRGCKQIREGCIRKIVRHCKKLESLVLANCTHIGNTALNEIATYLTNIRHIDLAGCKKVTNEGVKALATNCHQMTTLDISSTGIDQRSVTALASYCSKSLQGIKLNCCKEITEASIIKLLKHCKQLQTLHLYGVKRLHTLSVLKLQYPCLMFDEKSKGPPRY